MDQQHALVPVTDEPLNAETPLVALLDELTPAKLVYVRNHFAIPAINERTWSLSVDGMVERHLSLSLKELQAMETRRLNVTLECAGNGRKMMDPLPGGTLWGYGAVSIVQFIGTPLKNVLQKAGLQDEVIEIMFQGGDSGEVAHGRSESFSRSLPMEVALHPDTLLAWGMNGEPLSPEHGFPLRVVVPGWYGMASVKWLTKISAMNKPFEGYFQNEHYVYSEDQVAPESAPVRHIQPRALIVQPVNDTGIRRQEEALIEGISWSGYGSIVQVEVSVDGGDRWQEAELGPQRSRYDVQSWQFLWVPERVGSAVLMCRARDSGGNIQPDGQRWNRLGYGNNGPQKVMLRVT